MVRDAHAWTRFITEALALWAVHLEVVFASHHWSTCRADGASSTSRCNARSSYLAGAKQLL